MNYVVMVIAALVNVYNLIAIGVWCSNKFVGRLVEVTNLANPELSYSTMVKSGSWIDLVCMVCVVIMTTAIVMLTKENLKIMKLKKGA